MFLFVINRFLKPLDFLFSMNNILITGVPKSGKSTLLKNVLNGFDKPKKGFITKEIRDKDERTGFKIITSEGIKRTLSSVDINSPIKVSRYFVDVPGFEGILPPLFEFNKELLYIDEIGQMELYSNRFGELVNLYLNSPNMFLGTLSSVYSHQLIDFIRERNDVKILNLDLNNREEIFKEILTYMPQ